jgi:Flp pilus assembly protein TadD/4-amino-4-deoxy-L-arabinose transferase-like glycosyltransferase
VSTDKQNPARHPFPAIAKLAARPPLPMVFFIIAALGLCLRFVYTYLGRESPFYQPLILDPKYYHEWAKRLAEGIPDQEVFYAHPLYPYFLAVVYSIAGPFSLVAAKTLQHFLAIVTFFCVYKIGEKLSGRTAGIIATAIAAFYGPLIFHEDMLIGEAIGVPLFAAACYAACLLWEQRTISRGAAAGILLGLGTLTKGIGLFIFIVFLSALAYRDRAEKSKNTGAVCAYAVAFGLVLLPVTLHNLVRGGDFVLLTSHAGFNFYVGTQPEAAGAFKTPDGIGANMESQIVDSRRVAEQAEGRSLKPSAVSRYWSSRAWEAIWSDPPRFLSLCLKKLLLFFDAREFSDHEDYHFAARFNPFLKLPWPDFAWLGPLVWMGMAALYSGRNTLALPLGLWLASYAGGMMFFFIVARYRLPMLGLFFPIAAAGLVDVWDRIRRPDRRRHAAICLLAALAGAGVGQLGLAQRDPMIDLVNAGDAYILKKDYDRALDLYDEVLKDNPRHAKATLGMAFLLERTGRDDEARAYYLVSLESQLTADAYNNLGMLYDRRGEYAEAERSFLKALELKPTMAVAHNNLGMVYGKTGRNQEAISEFMKSLELDPRNPRPHTNLGIMLYRLERHGEARWHWEKALLLDPQFEEARKALDLFHNR